jgi:hypothetical protein
MVNSGDVRSLCAQNIQTRMLVEKLRRVYKDDKQTDQEHLFHRVQRTTNGTRRDIIRRFCIDKQDCMVHCEIGEK